MFLHLPFHTELSSTNGTYKTSLMGLFMCKRHLKHYYVKCVENDSIKKGNSKTRAKKAETNLGSQSKISRFQTYFTKIIKFLGTSWASVIANKHLLH